MLMMKAEILFGAADQIEDSARELVELVTRLVSFPAAWKIPLLRFGPERRGCSQ